MNRELSERIIRIRDIGLPIVCTQGRKIMKRHQLLGFIGNDPEFLSKGTISEQGIDLDGIYYSMKTMINEDISLENNPELYNSLCKAIIEDGGNTISNFKFNDLDFHQWYDSHMNLTYTALFPSTKFAKNRV